MIYEQISITFRDDLNEIDATFNEATFRVEGGILFIHKADNEDNIPPLRVDSPSPVFTIKEERILLLTVKAKV